MAEKKSKSKSNFTSGVSVFFGMTLVLFMLGLVGVSLLVSNQVANGIKEEVPILITLRKHVNEAETQAFKTWLDQKPYTRHTESVTREEAAEKLQEELQEEFLDFMGQNPLPASVDLLLKPAYTHPDSLEKICAGIEKNTSVRQVIWHKSLVDKMQSNIRKVSLFLLGFSVILLLIAVALINNTIRLAIFSKRFLIRSMYLVGATSRFIQRPFLVQAFWRGVLSGLLAFSMVMLLLYLFRASLAEFSDIRSEAFLNSFIFLFIGVLLTGICISFVSTKFAVRKYLKYDYGKLH